MNNEPAFPIVLPMAHKRHYGMSMRDYFAGQVISSLSDDYLPKEAARKAYEIADAMLEARNVP